MNLPKFHGENEISGMIQDDEVIVEAAVDSSSSNDSDFLLKMVSPRAKMMIHSRIEVLPSGKMNIVTNKKCGSNTNPGNKLVKNLNRQTIMQQNSIANVRHKIFLTCNIVNDTKNSTRNIWQVKYKISSR